MNVLEKIFEEIEERISFRNSIIRFEKKNGTITDVERNVKALNELVIIENIIRSHMDEADKKEFEFDFNRVESFDCQCGRRYVNTYNDGWIPVEERLPEEPEFMEDSYIVQQKNVIDPFSAYWDGKEWTDVNDDKVEEVIAWQPLPEPYRQKEKNNE